MGGGGVLMASVLAFVAGSGLVYGTITGLGPRIAARLAELEAAYGERMKDMFLSGMSARTLARIRVFGPAAIFLAGSILLGKPVVAAAAAVAAWLYPAFMLDRARERRRERLREQVLDVIAAITATTKAGLNLQESVQEVADKLPPPASQEFQLICERVKAGQTLDAAMRFSDKRIDDVGYSLVFKSLAVHREKGGRLADLLDRTGASLREMAQLESKVKSQTSGIRLAAKIMVAMPFVLGFILYLMDPDQIRILFDTFLGNIVLVVILVLDVVGFLMLKKLAEPDI